MSSVHFYLEGLNSAVTNRCCYCILFDPQRCRQLVNLSEGSDLRLRRTEKLLPPALDWLNELSTPLGIEKDMRSVRHCNKSLWVFGHASKKDLDESSPFILSLADGARYLSFSVQR